jgi:hypothetical protein
MKLNHERNSHHQTCLSDRFLWVSKYLRPLWLVTVGCIHAPEQIPIRTYSFVSNFVSDDSHNHSMIFRIFLLFLPVRQTVVFSIFLYEPHERRVLHYPAQTSHARGYRCRCSNTSWSRHMYICVFKGQYTSSVFSITEEVSCIVYLE